MMFSIIVLPTSINLVNSLDMFEVNVEWVQQHKDHDMSKRGRQDITHRWHSGISDFTLFHSKTPRNHTTVKRISTEFCTENL